MTESTLSTAPVKGKHRSDTLRILYVTARYSPYVGGVETHTAEVAKRLSAAGHHITVLTTTPNDEWPTLEETSGVCIRRERAWPKDRDYYFAPGIYHAIRRGWQNWDIVHCQGYHTLVTPVAMLAARRAGVPFVVTFHSGGHSSRLRNGIRGIQREVLRPLLARATSLIGVSKFEAEYFRTQLRLPAERFAVIPNGSSLPVVASPVREEALILSVGRLERYKGHQHSIAAMPHILRRRPDARLLIVGTGPYEIELRRLVARLGLEGSVEFTSVGGGDRAAMAALLARARLVTLLSDYEAHPIVVMEALAAGRPVLVTDIAGSRELAEGGLVRSIPLGSRPEDVATAVLYNLESPLVPQHVQLPTWEDCAANLLALYQNIMLGPRCVS